MKHGNYCGYALNDMLKMRSLLKDSKYIKSTQIESALIDLLIQAQKFVLPTDGRLSDGCGVSSNPELIRLPYDIVALEYSAPTPKDQLVMGTELSTRRIVLAFDSKCAAQYSNLFDYTDEDGIIVWPISYFDDVNKWTSSWAGTFIPLPLQVSKGSINESCSDSFNKKIRQFSAGDFTYNTKRLLHGEYAEDVVLATLKNGENPDDCYIVDTSSEVTVAVDFCYTLNYRNVTVQKAEAEPRKSTVKKSPKRVFDHHYLVINVDDTVRTKTSDIHKQSTSKCRHTRRRHLRRYANGKTKWIEAVEVNANKEELVTKTYIIEN